MNSSRHLAAIMCTDISGYTLMMQENEETAMNLLVRHREILEECTQKVGGEVLQYFGDGSLSIYPSALDAVRCALHIQNALRRPPVVPLRIGLHVGDIVQRQKSIFGDGVNLAFRIQAIGLPGSILFSQPVYDAIRNHPELPAVALGKVCFKHVGEPMDMYALAAGALVVPCRKDVQAGRSGDRAAWGVLLALGLLLWLGLTVGITDRYHNSGSDATVEKSSIAVLPFEYLDDNPDQAKLGAILHEEIINGLAGAGEWKVISRTTARQYRTGAKSITQIGRELGVAVVLEGGISISEPQIRITVRLIDTADDQVLWSDVFEETLDDVRQAPPKIVRAVCGQLPFVEPPPQEIYR